MKKWIAEWFCQATNCGEIFNETFTVSSDKGTSDLDRLPDHSKRCPHCRRYTGLYQGAYQAQ